MHRMIDFTIARIIIYRWKSIGLNSQAFCIRICSYTSPNVEDVRYRRSTCICRFPTVDPRRETRNNRTRRLKCKLLCRLGAGLNSMDNESWNETCLMYSLECICIFCPVHEVPLWTSSLCASASRLWHKNRLFHISTIPVVLNLY